MAGFMDILGSMIQQNMSGTGGSRITNAMGGSGGLGELMGSLTQMMGGAQSGRTSSAESMGRSGDLGSILGGVLGNLGNNKAALGGIGALAGALLGGGGGAARGALGGGGLAMLASLALSALKKAGQAPDRTPRAMLEPQTVQEQKALEADAEVIVKAMINAAKADGQIDETELQKIVGKMEQDGLTQEEKNFIISEAHKPLDLAGVVASAQGQADMAAQIYAASLLALEVDTEAERTYLKQLANGLGLSPEVTDHIEQTLGVRV